MRIDLRRIVPLLVALPLVGVGTAHLAANTVPPTSAGQTQVVGAPASPTPAHAVGLRR
jgi:hypothetical protein